MGDGRWKWFAPAADQESSEDVTGLATSYATQSGAYPADQSASDRQQQIGTEITQVRIDKNRGHRWPQR